MKPVLLFLAVLLTQAAFVTLVRKVHDRSIHQALGRALAWLER